MKKCNGQNGSCLKHPWPQSILKKRKETEWRIRKNNIKRWVLRKWKNTSCSWIGRINIKMIISLKSQVHWWRYKKERTKYPSQSQPGREGYKTEMANLVSEKSEEWQWHWIQQETDLVTQLPVQLLDFCLLVINIWRNISLSKKSGRRDVFTLFQVKERVLGHQVFGSSVRTREAGSWDFLQEINRYSNYTQKCKNTVRSIKIGLVCR